MTFRTLKTLFETHCVSVVFPLFCWFCFGSFLTFDTFSEFSQNVLDTFSDTLELPDTLPDTDLGTF